jgi:hypothetical protein
MPNDSGFSKIITIIVVILVLIIAGLWFSQYWNTEPVAEQTAPAEQGVAVEATLPEVFIFNPEGYQIDKHDLNTFDHQTVVYVDEAELYNILTKQTNQPALLLTTRYDKNIEGSAQTLFLIDITFGLGEGIFTLPNTVTGDGDTRYVISAEFNLDQSKVAYATVLTDGDNNTGLEVWEYDRVKDLHILISKIDSGTADTLDVIGYSSEGDYLVVYQYSNDGSLADIGQVKLIDLEDKEIDSNTWSQAIARYFDLNDDAEPITSIGRPFMSPDGGVMMFILPYGFYAEQYPDYFDKAVRDELVMYDMNTHELESVYLYNGLVENSLDVFGESAISYGLWQEEDFYFPSIDGIHKYSLLAERVQEVLLWPADLVSEGNIINSLLSGDGDSLLFVVPERTDLYYLDLELGEASILSFGSDGPEFYYYINQK